jgi:prephenate dehydrogenase
MTVAIIGLGLIGGSLAIAFRQQKLFSHLIGVEVHHDHQTRALARGLVDEILPLSEALKRANTIVLAVPVDATRTLLPTILETIAPNQTVFDVASTKLLIVEAVRAHPNRCRFVAAHPMAGTEFSGPDAAEPDLFRNCRAILCDTAESAPDAVARVTHLLQSIGMTLVEMNCEEHDLHAAYVSHISHVSSFALALSVLEKENYDEANILAMAAGGFRSTVRLAKSNPETWVPIFLQNSKNVQTVLDNYIEKLALFRHHLRRGNAEGLAELIREANKIRDILDNMRGTPHG